MSVLQDRCPEHPWNTARRDKRYAGWRPAFSLFQHDDLEIDGLELLYPSSHVQLAEQIQEDIRNLQPDSQVNLHKVDFKAPWDFEEDIPESSQGSDSVTRMEADRFRICLTCEPPNSRSLRLIRRPGPAAVLGFPANVEHFKN
ncbi:MAG TPA: hypothetical protein DCG12_01540 [Planctomycetaceae bacterium]|nr:hypothetical protein [Planctomycetaceae bacterium]